MMFPNSVAERVFKKFEPVLGEIMAKHAVCVCTKKLNKPSEDLLPSDETFLVNYIEDVFRINK
jgi:hypothetical protein